MIELLIDWLNTQIKQREVSILNGAISDILTYKVVRAEYQTLLAIREKAQQLAAGGGEDDEE